MYGIDNNTKLPEYTRLPLVPEGNEVVVLLTAAKETKGPNGHYAIFEGKVSQVIKGDLTKGQPVKVLMTRVDDTRRIVSGTNYAQLEVLQLLETINGSPFKKENLNEQVSQMCKNIEGMAVRITSRKKPGTADTKPFTERSFITVPSQDLGAQRLALKAL